MTNSKSDECNVALVKKEHGKGPVHSRLLYPEQVNRESFPLINTFAQYFRGWDLCKKLIAGGALFNEGSSGRSLSENESRPDSSV